MRRVLRKFIRSEDGATTVDWVVITAMAMSLGLAAFGSVKSGTGGVTSNISSTMSSTQVTTTF